MNEVDALAQRYCDIGEAIKALEDEKDALRVQLMALDGISGEFFRIEVTEYVQERLESLRSIRDKSEALFLALHELGAVRETKATRVNIKEIK